METAHKRPNYILIWVYLAVLTAAELGLAFELPISRNWKLILLLFLAVWKAALVGLFFMHLKFETRTLGLVAVTPLAIATLLIFVLLPDGFAVMKRTADVKAATTEPAKH